MQSDGIERSSLTNAILVGVLEFDFFINLFVFVTGIVLKLLGRLDVATNDYVSHHAAFLNEIATNGVKKILSCSSHSRICML